MKLATWNKYFIGLRLGYWNNRAEFKRTLQVSKFAQRKASEILEGQYN